MTTTKPSAAGVALKWSLIGLITSIVLTYAYQFGNIPYTSPIRYVSYIPFIGFLFMSQVDFKKLLGGFATFGEEFVAGLLYSVFAGIMAAIFIYVYFAILSPDVYQQVLDAQRTAMSAQGASSDAVDQSMNVMSKYGVLITSVIVLFATIVVGAIIAVVGAAIFNKKRTLQDIENQNPDPAV